MVKHLWMNKLMLPLHIFFFWEMQKLYGLDFPQANQNYVVFSRQHKPFWIQNEHEYKISEGSITK